MFGGTLATNMLRISDYFLNNEDQYVGLEGARIYNCLLFLAFSRDSPFGLFV